MVSSAESRQTPALFTTCFVDGAEGGWGSYLECSQRLLGLYFLLPQRHTLKAVSLASLQGSQEQPHSFQNLPIWAQVPWQGEYGGGSTPYHALLSSGKPLMVDGGKLGH